MLAQIFAIFVMLAILSILIIVHEFGHFSVARYFGFQTPVFGFGLPFGPHLTLGKKWGTEFRVYACLLGGFVAIPELGDESSLKEKDDAFGVPLNAFRKFPIWQRALVAFAGVGFNIIFAYMVMATMFFSLGQPSQPTVVYKLIQENPIAAQAGIKVNDAIVSVDGHPVAGPDDAVHLLTERKSQEVTLEILRDAKPLTIKVVTNDKGKVGMALVNKGPMTYTRMEGNPFQVAWAALVRLCTLTYNMFEALGMMVTGLFSGGGGGGGSGHPSVGLQDLHGVLAVIKIGADIAQQDWSQLFIFTIMISMDLAIINLLPWPALDGGHLAFMVFEALRGRPMGERAQGEIVKWGFISLLVLMAVVMVNDVTALISGKLDFKVKDGQIKRAKDKDKADNGAADTPADTAAETAASPTEPSTDPSKKQFSQEQAPVQNDDKTPTPSVAPDAGSTEKPVAPSR